MRKKKNKKKIKMQFKFISEIREIEIKKIEEMLKDKTLLNWSRVVLGEYLYNLKHGK